MKCGRCNKDLPADYDNVLEVEFSGGYGMFVDAWDRPRVALICHECAHELVDREQWMRDAIGDPLLSHSHVEGTVSDEHMAEQQAAWSKAAGDAAMQDLLR